MLPVKKIVIHPAVAIASTVGEFAFAGYLLFSHGDVFPMYLAIVYLYREQHSAAHAIVHVYQVLKERRNRK